MRRDFVPEKDAVLWVWGKSLVNGLLAGPGGAGGAGGYGVPDAAAEALRQAYEAFAGAFERANHVETRTLGALAAKDEAKRLFVIEVRRVSKLVQAFAGVTDEMRQDLRLAMRGAGGRSPRVGRPVDKPMLVLTGDRRALGDERRVRVRLLGAGKRGGRPRGVKGAAVFSYVGDVVPGDLKGWRWEGATTARETVVEFDEALEPGTTMWVTACWTNGRGELGPAGDQVGERRGFAGVAQTSE